MSDKRIVYYILTAFIAGTILLVFIQYNSAKNINALISGNETLLNEFNVSTELKELENDLISIESKIRGAVSTNDSMMIQGLETQTSEIKVNLGRLQKIADDDSSVQYIDQLDNLVNQKIKFSQMILDSFRIGGKAAAERVIGTRAGIDLTEDIAQTIANADRSRKKLLQEVTTKIDASGTKALRFSLILIVFVLVSAAALFWYIINIIQKQKQLIGDLNDSEKTVRQTARVKENFLANMSHEIRTPLNAILGFTNLLQRSNDPERSASYIKTIQSSGENLLNIINDILDLSKIEAGMLRIETTGFSIRSLLDSVEQMFRGKASEKSLSISSSVDADVPDYLEGDPTRLTQILVNLIGNAIKFTSSGSIKISVVNEGLTTGSIKTGIVVQDTGIGIDSSQLKGIFERFEQGDADVTRKFGGTGLGLSIVRDLVLLQNGTIDVESELGKGTAFNVVIPYLIPEVTAQSTDDKNVVRKAGEGFNNVRLLVAEDNEINQRLLRHLFDEWQISYDMKGNGKEAVEALQIGKYDLVLLDIQMPVMDGYTAAQEIREKLGSAVPIIAMTAHAMAGEREKCLSYGMTDYISKPIRENLLHSLIEKYAQQQNVLTGSADNHTPLPIDGAVSKELSPQLTGVYELIDPAYLHELSGGDESFEVEITDQFLESFPQEIDAFNNGYKINDTGAMRRMAHNLKTTISVMGLNTSFNIHLDAIENGALNGAALASAVQHINSMSDIVVKETMMFRKTLV